MTTIQTIADAYFDAMLIRTSLKRTQSVFRNAYRLAILAGGIGTNDYNKFVYTCRYGWIDHGHFFNNATGAYGYSRQAAAVLSEVNEVLQKLWRSPSAYTPEDLISNMLGRDLGQTAFWNTLRRRSI